MLVLSRKIGEELWIGDRIVVRVVAAQGGRVRIGITAPADVPIRRDELERGADGARGEPAPTCPEP